MNLREWVDVATFGSRVDAEVAGSALRADGIPFRIDADDLGGNLGVLAGARAGVRLLVPVEREADARATLHVGEPDPLLDAPTPTEPVGSGNGALHVVGQVAAWLAVVAIVLAVVLQFIT